MRITFERNTAFFMSNLNEYQQVKNDLVHSLNYQINQAAELPQIITQSHPVFNLISQENKLGQEQTYVAINGILHAFAFSYPVSDDTLIKAMQDGNHKQRSWNEVVKAITLSRLLVSPVMVNSVLDAIKSNQQVPANKIGNTLVAVFANILLVSWQLVKLADNQALTDALTAYCGKNKVGNLGHYEDFVPFDQSVELREFSVWVQNLLGRLQGLEQQLLMQNLLVSQKEVIDKKRVGISDFQVLTLYLAGFYLTQVLDPKSSNQFHQTVDSRIVIDLISHHSLKDVWMSYHSVGWVKDEDDE